MNMPALLTTRLTQASFVLLCIAAVSFPFSVAACNSALAACLGIGLLSGAYVQGARRVWREQRTLCIAWLAYLALFPLGLLWSLDVHRGLQIIGRQWFWLLIPLVVQLLSTDQWRRAFFLSLGTGLVLHLFTCLAQFGGVQLPALIPGGGSSSSNPTGYIGHTSFGLVYGLWAAYLLITNQRFSGWQCWGMRLLALWSVGMIFLASGRGGYLVVATLLLVTTWKLIRTRALVKLAVAGLLLLTIAAAVLLGPGKARVLDSWHSMQAVEHGNFRTSEVRWSMWYMAIDIWRQHMPLGVGTGGFHVASPIVMKQNPELYFAGYAPSHPHNMLLQSLSRWGPIGVLLLAALYVVWIRLGWRCDWPQNAAVSLVSLSGIALFVQGLTEPSFEEHFPGVLAVMLLGAGLAAWQSRGVEATSAG